MPYRDEEKRKLHIKALTAPSVVLTMRMMEDSKPRTVREIADTLGLSRVSIQDAMSALEFHNKAHIQSYRPLPIGGHAPVWVLGEGVNAKKPRKQTMKERTAKQAGYAREWKARKKAEKKAKTPPVVSGQFVPHRDPLIAALFGDAPAKT